jgi:hypothetical protein
LKAVLDKKKTDLSIGLLRKKAGVVLLSHTVTRAIPSPQVGLTSEFGMGSGVALLLKTPAKLVAHENARRLLRQQQL